MLEGVEVVARSARRPWRSDLAASPECLAGWGATATTTKKKTTTLACACNCAWAWCRCLVQLIVPCVWLEVDDMMLGIQSCCSPGLPSPSACGSHRPSKAAHPHCWRGECRPEPPPNHARPAA